jgi:3-hydroxybutyryl-CoA dehydrogenase
MGSQIAQAFSQAGLSVRAFDVNGEQLSAGMTLIKTGKYGLESLVSKNRLSREVADRALSRIAPAGTIEETTADADLIIEAAIEDLGAKRAVFRNVIQKSNFSEDATLATNTSTLSISSICEPFPPDIRRRFLGMHFFNPPQVMKLIEIVRMKETDERAISRLQVLSRSLGKTPIVVLDVPGFVANRIGISVFAEASSLLERGVSSVKDIDTAMRLGYGYPMGPFELADLVGLESRLRNMQALYQSTGDERFKPPSILEVLVKEGYLGDPKTKKGSRGGYYEYYGLERTPLGN